MICVRYELDLLVNQLDYFVNRYFVASVYIALHFFREEHVYQRTEVAAAKCEETETLAGHPRALTISIRRIAWFHKERSLLEEGQGTHATSHPYLRPLPLRQRAVLSLGEKRFHGCLRVGEKRCSLHFPCPFRGAR